MENIWKPALLLAAGFVIGYKVASCRDEKLWEEAEAEIVDRITDYLCDAYEEEAIALAEELVEG